MMSMKKNLFLSLLILVLMNTSCFKPVGYGDIDVQISYTANGSPLITDSLCYTNEAGNRFLVNEIQWFVSKITLKSEQGDEYVLSHRVVNSLFTTPQEKVFYIDTNLPESQILELNSLPCQRYISMQMTFGLDQDDNHTGFFTDAPENDMFWPDPLGGGYHYMKLNGKYVDGNGLLAPLNIHLGIGQNAEHTTFYQNYFTVEFPLDLNLDEKNLNVIQLDMNIDNWFRNPNIYDFQVFGSAIMQNQEAQQCLKENGHDVFSVTIAESPRQGIGQALRSVMRKASPKPNFYTKKNMENLFAEFSSRKDSK